MREYQEDEEKPFQGDETTGDQSEDNFLIPKDKKGSYQSLNKSEPTDGRLELWPQMSTVDIGMKFTSVAMPSIFSCFLTQLITSITTIFIGQLGDVILLAGVGLGISVINIICFSIMCGVNAAAQTLASQAFGYGDLHRVGVIHNRGIAILTAFFIPLAIAVSQTESIMIALGQDPEVASIAHRFVIMTLPGYYLAGLVDLSRLILVSMQLADIPLIASVAATLSHAFWCYILIIKFDLGIEGCGAATVLTFFVQLMIMSVYPYFVAEIKESLVPFSIKDCFSGWKEYISISAPAALMVCAEWWCFEITILFAGLVGPDDQAAQVICLGILAQLFMIAQGIQEASATLVGNTIGADQAELSKRITWTLYMFTSLIKGSIGLILYIAWSDIIKTYTKEEEVVSKAIQIAAIIAVTQFVNGLQGFLQGPIRAIGKQGVASGISLIAYYVIALPASLYLCFAMEYGIGGLWMGIMLGSAAQTVLFTLLIAFTDWQAIADQSTERIEKEAQLH